MAFIGQFWVVAEIAEIKQSANGHLYMELVEKIDSALVAKAQAVIWHNKGVDLRQKFGNDLPLLLKKGNKVLFRALLDFHPIYGLKLVISDLDASVTIGEMELRRRAILKQLQAEQLLRRNAQCPLPLVLQQLAVISSPTAAGYGDFVNHLQQNPYGYAITHTLFAAAMQGDNVEPEISAQLKAIAHQKHLFDAVVIIRGGGSKLDLAAFDNYILARDIAHFPLPVLTGIGHQQDECLLDLVAHTPLKTPTAVAEFVLNSFIIYESQITRYFEQLILAANNRINKQQFYLKETQTYLQYVLQMRLKTENDTLQNLSLRLKQGISHLLQNENRKLDFIEKKIQFYDVANLLRRGLAIVRKEGQIVSGVQQLNIGDEITIQLADGEVNARIV